MMAKTSRPSRLSCAAHLCPILRDKTPLRLNHAQRGKPTLLATYERRPARPTLRTAQFPSQTQRGVGHRVIRSTGCVPTRGPTPQKGLMIEEISIPYTWHGVPVLIHDVDKSYIPAVGRAGVGMPSVLGVEARWCHGDDT